MRLALGLALLASTFATTLPYARAQPGAKVERVGFLTSGTASASTGMVEAFREGMREQGWVEGRNLAVDYRFAEGRFDRLPALAAELVRNDVALIVAATSAAVVAVRSATRTTPIVMANVADPVGLGLVDSVARPGTNVTGLAYSFGSEVWGKQVQLLVEAVPGIRRMAVLSNAGNPGHERARENVKSAGAALNVPLVFLQARTAGDLDGAFAAMTRQRADAVLVLSDPLFGSHADRVAKLALDARLPSMHGARSNVEAGGLMFYGPNLVYQLRQAAVYADRILKGAKPAELPVEQPTQFDLIVNLKTARALGLAIPPSVLGRADRIVE